MSSRTDCECFRSSKGCFQGPLDRCWPRATAALFCCRTGSSVVGGFLLGSLLEASPKEGASRSPKASGCCLLVILRVFNETSSHSHIPVVLVFLERIGGVQPEQRVCHAFLRLLRCLGSFIDHALLA